MLEQNNKVYTYIILIVNEREATQFSYNTFVNVLSIEYFLYVNHLQNPETVKLQIKSNRLFTFATYFKLNRFYNIFCHYFCAESVQGKINTFCYV